MHIPTPMIYPGPHPATAAQALELNHGNAGVAIGVILIIAWFITHRFAAHRHPVVEWIAKALLLAAGVALAVSIGAIAKWVADINDSTANWLSDKTGDPTFANLHLGLLTVLAIVDVAFALSVTVDLIRHLRNKGGSGNVKYHPRWGSMEDLFNRYGWFGLGPLSATLPGQIGVWVATLLALLSEQITHAVGNLFGLA